jgi:hypothetical protein
VDEVIHVFDQQSYPEIEEKELLVCFELGKTHLRFGENSPHNPLDDSRKEEGEGFLVHQYHLLI